MEFLVWVHPSLSQQCRNPDYIVNMDKIPLHLHKTCRRLWRSFEVVPFTYKNSTNDTKRATFTMTMTASGKMLLLVLVFKG